MSVCVLANESTCVRTRVCMYVCMHACTHVCMHTCLCAWVCMYGSTLKYVCATVYGMYLCMYE